MSDSRIMTARQAEAVKMAAMPLADATDYERAKRWRYAGESADLRRRERLAAELERLRAESRAIGGV